ASPFTTVPALRSPPASPEVAQRTFCRSTRSRVNAGSDLHLRCLYIYSKEYRRTGADARRAHSMRRPSCGLADENCLPLPSSVHLPCEQKSGSLSAAHCACGKKRDLTGRETAQPRSGLTMMRKVFEDCPATIARESEMGDTATPIHHEATEEVGALTDGFHLVINALKLNDISTIYNVPGIPITDLGRSMHAAGMRVLSFRHEQNAGYAAAIAGFLTKKPGICLTVSAPGFLNGLTALAHATTNCFPMILISGSSEREIVDLQQGDYEEMDQLAIAKPLCKAAYRVLHAEDIG